VGFRGGVAAFPSSAVANRSETRVICRGNDVSGFIGSSGFVAVGTAGIGGGSGHTQSTTRKSGVERFSVLRAMLEQIYVATFGDVYLCHFV
jgi:hypothetical protein